MFQLDRPAALRFFRGIDRSRNQTAGVAAVAATITAAAAGGKKSRRGGRTSRRGERAPPAQPAIQNARPVVVHHILLSG
jgi:hypothetical protein